VFNYRDEGVVENIRAATGNCNALDIANTIPECKTPEQVTGTIGNKVGKVAIILPTRVPGVRLSKLSSAYFLTRFNVYKWRELSFGVSLITPFVGIKRQVVRRPTHKDPKAQAHPCFHTTQRN